MRHPRTSSPAMMTTKRFRAALSSIIIAVATSLPATAVAARVGPKTPLVALPATSSSTTDPVARLIERLLPQHTGSFVVAADPPVGCGDNRCFEIRDGEGGIMLAGTTGVERAAALHHYLKILCGVHLSWDATGGAQLASVPPVLPRVPGGLPIRVTYPFKRTLYFNTVTFSYSTAFWSLKRWRREVEWMALHGEEGRVG